MDDFKSAIATLLICVGLALFIPFVHRITPTYNVEIRLEIRNR